MFRGKATLWMYLIAVLAGLGAVVPLAWLFMLSLDPSQGAATSGAVYSLQNYSAVLFESLMARYFLNTALVALATVACTLICACMGAYAASRYRFRGREAAMVGLLVASMTPVIAVLVPLYAYAAKLQMLNTYQILIVIFTAWQLPGTLWLIRSFMDAIPVELEEAALVDGCTRAGAFFRVVLPQLAPGLVAAGLIVFVYVWNEFIVAVSLAPKQDMRLISVGLYFYLSEFGIEWGKISAGAILSILPPAALFLFLQRKLIHGLSAGAVK
ncbi:carbohydrate ABC transporter permease [Pollutimonas bauzanensis]|uniref:Carbohydrate ABC transporter membrane protein 2, CUT1 family n=1 Tax=Pollutimonas bauzanensis TaxID=658167 RepID=A0A1M5Z8W2_9BURK|nr:carbohydrate ABC transporter permease [Pollutimonas bauzanensis]SHI20641.1 carbohydrate ABC transporter membrane protein 2, CUT1 family [Pollutimonas bauzanensis]